VTTNLEDEELEYNSPLTDMGMCRTLRRTTLTSVFLTYLVEGLYGAEPFKDFQRYFRLGGLVSRFKVAKGSGHTNIGVVTEGSRAKYWP
jgi:hypothetical protein